MLLHGHGDHPEQLSDALTGAGGLDRDEAALVAPIGPTKAVGGPAWFPSEVSDTGPPLTEALHRLDALVARIRAEHRLAGLPLVIVGYSQGGAAALAAAFAAGGVERVAAVVGLAAWLPAEPDVQWCFEHRATVRASLLHARDDEVVDPRLGRSAARVLRRHGVDAATSELAGGHRIDAPQATALAQAIRDHLPARS